MRISFVPVMSDNVIVMLLGSCSSKVIVKSLLVGLGAIVTSVIIVLSAIFSGSIMVMLFHLYGVPVKFSLINCQRLFIVLGFGRTCFPSIRSISSVLTCLKTLPPKAIGVGVVCAVPKLTDTKLVHASIELLSKKVIFGKLTDFNLSHL